jgi:hypothetical protein
MNQRLRACFTLGLILIGGAGKFCRGAIAESLEIKQQDLRITIQIFNYARIAQDTLTEAEREAMNILGRAGVKIIWVDCISSNKVKAWQRPCDGLYDSTNLFLEIEPCSTVKTLRLNETMLGACTASTDGGYHTQALVSYGRVEFLAFQWDIDRGRILGAAAAHEIGHLLLRQTSHSNVGIMRAECRKEDFQPFNRRCLRFTDEQAKAVRAEVIARFNLPKGAGSNTVGEADFVPAERGPLL